MTGGASWAAATPGQKPSTEPRATIVTTSLVSQRRGGREYSSRPPRQSQPCTAVARCARAAGQPSWQADAHAGVDADSTTTAAAGVDARACTTGAAARVGADAHV